MSKLKLAIQKICLLLFDFFRWYVKLLKSKALSWLEQRLKAVKTQIADLEATEGDWPKIAWHKEISSGSYTNKILERDKLKRIIDGLKKD